MPVRPDLLFYLTLYYALSPEGAKQDLGGQPNRSITQPRLRPSDPRQAARTFRLVRHDLCGMVWGHEQSGCGVQSKRSWQDLGRALDHVGPRVSRSRRAVVVVAVIPTAARRAPRTRAHGAHGGRPMHAAQIGWKRAFGGSAALFLGEGGVGRAGDKQRPPALARASYPRSLGGSHARALSLHLL